MWENIRVIIEETKESIIQITSRGKQNKKFFFQ